MSNRQSENPNENNQKSPYAFPISLTEDYKGTQEIPYAPDSRPSMPSSVRPRRATKRPANFTRDTATAAAPAPVPEMPMASEPRQPIIPPEDIRFSLNEMTETDAVSVPAKNDPIADAEEIDLIFTDLIKDSSSSFQPTPPSEPETPAAAEPEENSTPVTEPVLVADTPKQAPQKAAVHPSNTAPKKAAAKKSTIALIWLPTVLCFIIVAAIAFLLLWDNSKKDPEKESSHTSELTSSSEAAPSGDISDSRSISSDSGSTSADSEDISDAVSGSYAVSDVSLESDPYTQSYQSNGNTCFRVNANIPVIRFPTNPKAQKAVNSALAKEYDAVLKEVDQIAADYTEHQTDTDTPLIPGSYDSDCRLYYGDERFFTVMDTAETYNGGATSYATVTCYNFRVKDGSRLEIGDYIGDTRGLCDLLIEKFQKDASLNCLIHESLYKNYIKENICDAWYLSSGGLVLVYRQYSIGPGASGTIEVVLSEAEYAPYLAAEFST